VSLGDVLKTIRKQTGLNQTDFGVLIGKTQKEISEYESGKTVEKYVWAVVSKKFNSEIARTIANGIMFEEIMQYQKIS